MKVDKTLCEFYKENVRVFKVKALFRDGRSIMASVA